MTPFAERLKELRTSKNLTQSQLASIFNTSERGYRNYEIGKSTPSFENLIKLADYFDVSIDFLTGRTDFPYSHKLTPPDNPTRH